MVDAVDVRAMHTLVYRIYGTFSYPLNLVTIVFLDSGSLSNLMAAFLTSLIMLVPPEI